VQAHAFALLPTEARLLATPAEKHALSRCLQAVGRRYVSTYNRRHRRSGTLWSGRFRCAAVEPGSPVLSALRFVDGASPEPALTSARHRCGGRRELWLVDPPAYWSLGNTPFERERAYAQLLAEPLPESDVARIRRCLAGGWPIGAAGFLRALEAERSRRVAPRPRGRPARIAP
jgi:putative transposase